MICNRQARLPLGPIGRTETSCTIANFAAVVRGKSARCREWVRRLETPDFSAASIAALNRAELALGKICESDLPAASSAFTPLAVANQAFQLWTRLSWS